VKKVLVQPTPEMLSVCRDIEIQIEIFLEVRQEVPPLGTHEAPIEADCLFNLAIRHVEGVLELARKDVVLLPPAVAAARAAFEAAVKAAWLVDMDDPMDCEARWLMHLESEERYLSRMAGRMSKNGAPDEALLRRANRLRTFREAVAQAMPVGVNRILEVPTFEQMLGSIGGRERYVLYIETSQYIHAEHAATWLYRRGGVGTAKELGEFVEPKDWWLPLRLAWLSFARPAEIFLMRVGAPPEKIRVLGRDQQLAPLISQFHVKSSDSLH
jgi:hypothetical protein